MTYAVSDPGWRCAAVFAPGGNATCIMATDLPGTSRSGSQDSSCTCVDGAAHPAVSLKEIASSDPSVITANAADAMTAHSIARPDLDDAGEFEPNVGIEIMVMGT